MIGVEGSPICLILQTMTQKMGPCALRRPSEKELTMARNRLPPFCVLSSLVCLLSLLPGEALPQEASRDFRRGDTDASGVVDISDPIFNLYFQFLGGVVLVCQVTIPKPLHRRLGQAMSGGELRVGGRRENRFDHGVE